MHVERRLVANVSKHETTLPADLVLLEKLDLLGEARDEGRYDHARHYETEILAIVAPGKYKGYLADQGMEVSEIRVTQVLRTKDDRTANIYSFSIEYEILFKGKPTSGLLHMHLMEFLKDVVRVGNIGEGYRGPRFWPVEQSAP